MNRVLACAALGLTLLCSVAVCAAARGEAPTLPAVFVEPLAARPLGPANMGGRITDLAVVESRPSTLYAASASGGLWKTVNNGITWTPVFERETTIALGAVTVAPSNPEVVWVGTGEANARNSVSWGDGVYQSTDGGKTWKNRGLRDTQHIGRIVIHPKDPNTVYVAALGHIWGANAQRGIFKTADGGKTWAHSLPLDADTGCIDLTMDPGDPDTLYAAAYRVRRDGFSGPNPKVQFGSAAGLYRTRDGGKTWHKLTNGLPRRPIGRCGLAIARHDPRIVYAVIQTDRTNILTTLGQPPRTNDQPDTGGVFRSSDRGETWVKLNDLCPRPFYYGQIRLDPRDEQRVYVLGIALYVSRDGGKTFTADGARDAHADHHALWIDPADSDHLVLGCDGGVYFSYDRGAHWEHVRNLPIAQFYAAAVDMRLPYRVYGGLQDNGSWGSPSATRHADGITTADWFRILDADGFQCQVDPDDPDTVYAETQYGGLYRLNVRKGGYASIRPRPPSRLSPDYRFNWNAPLVLSRHNRLTLYYGGNHLFQSIDRGDTWKVVSPDLTHGRPGPSADRGHTLTAIAESPRKAGVLYAGTDDGRVHVTRNDGATWTDVSARIPDVPVARHISRLECSPFDEGTAWLTIDRHRNDDRKPYLFRTDDFGATWKPLANNLPKDGPVHVVRADPRNRHLLFAGTEFGLFFSLNDGASWQHLGSGLPTVAVHDLVIHPRDRDLIIATHGRGMYIVDIAPLEEMTETVRAAPYHLFDVKLATLFEYRGGHGTGEGKNYRAPNPPFGAAIWYSLREKTAQPVRLQIADAAGRVLVDVAGQQGSGLHRLQWNLRGASGFDLERGARMVPPGEYAVRLLIGGQMRMAKKLRVEAEP
jgi:photosystem II stability/assembly factor-like uncharacterized protein